LGNNGNGWAMYKNYASTGERDSGPDIQAPVRGEDGPCMVEIGANLNNGINKLDRVPFFFGWEAPLHHRMSERFSEMNKAVCLYKAC